MGAIMGPTVVRQRFQVDADGSASVELVRNLMRSLQGLSKREQLPPFQLEPAAADAHIAGYKKWLHQFLSMLGYQESTSYIGLHILRKHIIVQTVLASCGTKPSNASEAEQCLQRFSSARWFNKQSTMRRLADLVPDQGEYLQTVGTVMKVGSLLGPHIVTSWRQSFIKSQRIAQCVSTACIVSAYQPASASANCSESMFCPCLMEQDTQNDSFRIPKVKRARWNRSSSNKLLGVLVSRPLHSCAKTDVHFLVGAFGANPRERKQVARSSGHAQRPVCGRWSASRSLLSKPCHANPSRKFARENDTPSSGKEVRRAQFRNRIARRKCQRRRRSW